MKNVGDKGMVTLTPQEAEIGLPIIKRLVEDMAAIDKQTGGVIPHSGILKIEWDKAIARAQSSLIAIGIREDKAQSLVQLTINDDGNSEIEAFPVSEGVSNEPPFTGAVPEIQDGKIVGWSAPL